MVVALAEFLRLRSAVKSRRLAADRRRRRPTAVTLSPDGRRAYVVNTHDDIVSVLDLYPKR